MKTCKTLVMLLCSLFLLVALSGVATVQAADATASTAAGQAVASVININQADIETLATLPGIGPKIAERITAYRESNGPFQSVDELINVKGIGEKMLEKIKPLITVS